MAGLNGSPSRSTNEIDAKGRFLTAQTGKRTATEEMPSGRGVHVLA